MLAIESACTAERSGDRQVETLREARECAAGSFGPAWSSKDRDRPLSAPEQLLQLGHLCETGPNRDRNRARRIDHRGWLKKHVLGQRDHHRSRPSLHCDVKGTMDDFGDLRGSLDLGDPFGCRAEKAPIVHLLKGAAPEHCTLDLADEQDHRRGIVFGDMDAVRGVGCAWTAGDEANSWSSRQASLG